MSGEFDREEAERLAGENACACSQQLRAAVERIGELEADGCRYHADQHHGSEAEELRTGIERLIADADKSVHVSDLQQLLDEVDARDSLAHLEEHNALRSQLSSTREKYEQAVREVEEVRKERDWFQEHATNGGCLAMGSCKPEGLMCRSCHDDHQTKTALRERDELREEVERLMGILGERMRVVGNNVDHGELLRTAYLTGREMEALRTARAVMSDSDIKQWESYEEREMAIGAIETVVGGHRSQVGTVTTTRSGK